MGGHDQPWPTTSRPQRQYLTGPSKTEIACPSSPLLHANSPTGPVAGSWPPPRRRSSTGLCGQHAAFDDRRDSLALARPVWPALRDVCRYAAGNGCSRRCIRAALNATTIDDPKSGFLSQPAELRPIPQRLVPISGRHERSVAGGGRQAHPRPRMPKKATICPPASPGPCSCTSPTPDTCCT